MKSALLPLLAALAMFLGACSAPTFPVTGSKPDLVLASAQTRTLVGSSAVITFPAGRYVATYRTAAGTYYQAQGAVFVGQRREEWGAGVVILDDGGQAFHSDGSRVDPRLEKPLDFNAP